MKIGTIWGGGARGVGCGTAVEIKVPKIIKKREADNGKGVAGRTGQTCQEQQEAVTLSLSDSILA